MIEHLERVVEAIGPRVDCAGEDHPMRRVTQYLARNTGQWEPEQARQVAALFDELASGWHTRDSPQRFDVVADAFARGGPIPAGTWVELGSGTGLFSRWLAARCARLVAVDPAGEMLALAPADVGYRVRADGARVPVAGGSVDALVLINAFLFPEEARRLLRPEGAVVWVNTSGPGTPIYLPAEEVVAALGPDWDAVAAEAGWGTWAVARRR